MIVFWGEFWVGYYLVIVVLDLQICMLNINILNK